ncbi:hypothetical protein M885DRAFT_557438 [Pelagophyceae sp. CCMP2097]|nr:hypothetical protein M885DRAFT_557438 [Pelagophyceae sp. CCMP2097]
MAAPSSTVAWLREAVPRRDGQIAAARLHYDGVEQMGALNAAVYGVGALETWGAASAARGAAHAVDGAHAALGDLRGRVAALEAEAVGQARRTTQADARAARLCDDADARGRADGASYAQRLAVAENRAANAERAAHDALAAARAAGAAGADGASYSQRLSAAEARASNAERAAHDALASARAANAAFSASGGDSELQRRFARLEAVVDLQQSQLQGGLALTRGGDDGRAERSLVRSEREAAASRAAVDELRSRLQRAEARADDEQARGDATRERCARAEEQSLSLRAAVESLGTEFRQRLEDLAADHVDSRERTARGEQRLVAVEARVQDGALSTATRLDMLTVEFNFHREHQTRLEEQMRQLRDGGDDDDLLSPLPTANSRADTPKSPGFSGPA